MNWLFKLALTSAIFLPAAIPVEYPIDINHSNIGFSVPIMGGLSHVEGKFGAFTAQLIYDEAEVEKSSVKATIKVASITTGVSGRDEHLRSEDFFDVARFPTIEFESTKVERSVEGLLVTGDFTMHGVTKRIALPVKFVGERTVEKRKLVAFRAEIELDRQDYGISWRHPSPEVVGDKVKVTLQILTKLK